MKSVQSCRCFHSKPIALLQIHRHIFKTPIKLFPGVLTAAARFSHSVKKLAIRPLILFYNTAIILYI